MNRLPALAVSLSVSVSAASLGLALLHVLTPTPAAACSPLLCRPGAVLPSGGSVPASAVEFVWRAPSIHHADAGTAPTPHLFSIEGSVRTELETTLELRGDLIHVTPKNAIPAGSQLVFEYQESCGTPGVTTSEPVQVTAAAALPSALGSLRADVREGPVTVWVTSGECTAPVEGVYADLNVDLSVSAQPFADVLRYQLVVDGARTGSYDYHDASALNPRLGSSRLGAAKDRVYVLCGTHRGTTPASGLVPGSHRVRIVGILPDNTELPSNEVEVELRCSPSADGGASDGGPQASVDASVSDASAGGPTGADDAAIASDGGISALDAAPVSPTPAASDAGDDDGCSLAHGSSRGAGALWGIAVALAALLQRRRRSAQ